jgi:hypothetical protein
MNAIIIFRVGIKSNIIIGNGGGGGGGGLLFNAQNDKIYFLLEGTPGM